MFLIFQGPKIRKRLNPKEKETINKILTVFVDANEEIIKEFYAILVNVNKNLREKFEDERGDWLSEDNVDKYSKEFLNIIIDTIKFTNHEDVINKLKESINKISK
jgi:hemoglobin-like flavoprotein